MRWHLRWIASMSLVVGVLAVAGGLSQGQPPFGGKKGEKKPAETAAEFLGRMLQFDKDKDGKLTKEEVVDQRLHALLQRADTNKDGVVTREELEALFGREALAGGGGPKGKGPPDDKKGPKGKGPPGGFGPPPSGSFDPKTPKGP